MNYFIYLDDKVKGPYAIEQLRSMWRNGLVNANTPLREQGRNEWLKLEILSTELGQQPPFVPMKIGSTKTKLSRKSKPTKKILVVATSAAFAVILLAWFASETNKPSTRDATEPMAASGIESLPPI